MSGAFCEGGVAVTWVVHKPGLVFFGLFVAQVDRRLLLVLGAAAGVRVVNK